ncbi:hypothetical protein ACQP00_32005 [Dactylosporangium sp. CS-047395]|uniref:hypothetical protein n=1 Tax=Dactylosporangium sp. CS-047395 TaxID=3239936 RepID=UPI003D8C760E
MAEDDDLVAALEEDGVPPLPADRMLALNGWSAGAALAAPVAERRARWITGLSPVARGRMLAPAGLDPWRWQDERLGWGLVLPEREELSVAQRARPDDAPEPIRQLFADRPGAKVLRYRTGKRLADFTLRDYTADGRRLPHIAGPTGTGPGQIPAYLLIAASPREIPWTVQYALNLVRNVGRLDLDEDGLANYVTALRDGWKSASARYDSPVVWSVDDGSSITALMRDAIGEPLAGKLRGDKDMPRTCFIDGRTEPADGAALIAALERQRPALIVTTSHGVTPPPVDADRLGLPVDATGRPLDLARLLRDWQPDGAIWYAHACCSAGSDGPSQYDGLFEPGSMVARALADAATLGPRTAALPRALLGAARPARGFIGQVEPTFDWTLRFPATRQRLTEDLRRTLYEELCAGRPAGYALHWVHGTVNGLQYFTEKAVKRYNELPPGPEQDEALDMALYHKVTGLDRTATVLLGDPTVALLPPAA